MAARTTGPVYAKPARRGSKMTLSLAGNPMVAIGFRMAPLASPGSGRLAGHIVCAKHLTQTRSVPNCDDCGGPCEETVTAYDWDGKVISIDKDALGQASDSRLELQALVDTASIDPLYFEKSFELWPEDGQEPAFDLLAAALRSSGRSAVGTAVLNKATKAVVLRWSELAGCVVAHACTYDARIAWEDVQQIQAGAAARGEIDEAKAAEAAKLFLAALSDEFPFDQIEDVYAVDLEAAVEAAASGVAAPVKAVLPEPSPVVDLMEALRASVAATNAGKSKAKTEAAA